MEFFLDQVQMILPVLGFDFTQPRPGAGAREGAASESPAFELRKVGAVATAQEIDGQFVVFAGSTARKKGVPSWQSYKALREKLVADGSLVDSDDPACLVFAENVAFNSPSAAASAVMARASNGRANWTVKATRESYRYWQDAKLAAVVQAGQLGDDASDSE